MLGRSAPCSKALLATARAAREPGPSLLQWLLGLAAWRGGGVARGLAQLHPPLPLHQYNWFYDFTRTALGTCPSAEVGHVTQLWLMMCREIPGWSFWESSSRGPIWLSSGLLGLYSPHPPTLPARNAGRSSISCLASIWSKITLRRILGQLTELPRLHGLPISGLLLLEGQTNFIYFFRLILWAAALVS